jgi:trimeric autotransporter adhesin
MCNLAFLHNGSSFDAHILTLYVHCFAVLMFYHSAVPQYFDAIIMPQQKAGSRQQSRNDSGSSEVHTYGLPSARSTAVTAAGESPRPATSASATSDVSDDAPHAAVSAPRRRPVSGPTLKSDVVASHSRSQPSQQQQQQQREHSAANGAAFAAIDNAATVLATQQQQQQRRRRRSSDASSSSVSNAAAGASAALRRVTLSAGATISTTSAASTTVAAHTAREEDAALFRCIALKGSLKEKLAAYDQGRALQSSVQADSNSSSSAAAAAEHELATDSFVQLLSQSNPAHKRPRAGSR